jgi:hypothetical protein
MSHPLLLNEDEAYTVLSEVKDPITQNLVKFAIARLRMRLAAGGEGADAAWQRRLPAAPFDMCFLVQVLIDMFEKQRAIRQVLDGKTIAEATGWDV